MKLISRIYNSFKKEPLIFWTLFTVIVLFILCVNTSKNNKILIIKPETNNDLNNLIKREQFQDTSELKIIKLKFKYTDTDDLIKHKYIKDNTLPNINLSDNEYESLIFLYDTYKLSHFDLDYSNNQPKYNTEIRLLDIGQTTIEGNNTDTLNLKTDLFKTNSELGDIEATLIDNTDFYNININDKALKFEKDSSGSYTSDSTVAFDNEEIKKNKDFWWIRIDSNDNDPNTDTANHKFIYIPYNFKNTYLVYKSSEANPYFLEEFNKVNFINENVGGEGKQYLEITKGDTKKYIETITSSSTNDITLSDNIDNLFEVEDIEQVFMIRFNYNNQYSYIKVSDSNPDIKSIEYSNLETSQNNQINYLFKLKFRSFASNELYIESVKYPNYHIGVKLINLKSGSDDLYNNVDEFNHIELVLLEDNNSDKNDMFLFKLENNNLQFKNYLKEPAETEWVNVKFNYQTKYDVVTMENIRLINKNFTSNIENQISVPTTTKYTKKIFTDYETEESEQTDITTTTKPLLPLIAALRNNQKIVSKFEKSQQRQNSVINTIQNRINNLLA